MINIYDNLYSYFDDIFSQLKCHRDTRAYVIGVYEKYKYNKNDLSKESIGLLFLEAKLNQNFEQFQIIGDWLTFSFSMFPEHLKSAGPEYYSNIARLSYYSCFRLVNKTWPVYENLADDFIPLTNKIRSSLVRV